MIKMDCVEIRLVIPHAFKGIEEYTSFVHPKKSYKSLFFITSETLDDSKIFSFMDNYRHSQVAKVSNFRPNKFGHTSRRYVVAILLNIRLTELEEDAYVRQGIETGTYCVDLIDENYNGFFLRFNTFDERKKFLFELNEIVDSE